MEKKEKRVVKYANLPADFKQKWIMALRSGKYKKCSETLREEDEDTGEQNYCVLGVAYQVSQKELIPSGLSTIPSGAKCVPDDLKDARVQEILYNKNDGGWSFNRLADWIEKHL